MSWSSEWEDWFAWFPVYAWEPDKVWPGKRWIWFRFIKRKPLYLGQSDRGWDYRIMS